MKLKRERKTKKKQKTELIENILMCFEIIIFQLDLI